jgi:hypothetical protein
MNIDSTPTNICVSKRYVLYTFYNSIYNFITRNVNLFFKCTWITKVKNTVAVHI